MSFVTTLPAELASVAGELQTIGCAVAAGSMAAATATTGMTRCGWTCPTWRTGRC
jgi:hypothetical protein